MVGDGASVDGLSVGEVEGVSVETTAACPKRHPLMRMARRQAETRMSLLFNLDCMVHLRFFMFNLLFIFF
jgi:hypothetical protein